MMVGVPMHFRTTLLFLMICQLHNARSLDVGQLLSSVLEGLYHKIPEVLNRHETSVQERPNDELSVLQEIELGRHGVGQAFHLFGDHDEDEEVVDLVAHHQVARDEEDPQNIVDA